MFKNCRRKIERLLTSPPGEPLQPGRPGKPPSPYRGNQRDPSSTTANTGNDTFWQRWAVGIGDSHLAPIDSISSPETFVSLGETETKSELKKINLTFRSVPGRTAPPVVAYLVAFVPSFTLQRREARLSPVDALTLKTNTNIVFAACDRTFSPLGPRSPWKQKDTYQKAVSTVNSQERNANQIQRLLLASMLIWLP